MVETEPRRDGSRYFAGVGMTYKPAHDDCRVCGCESPHVWRWHTLDMQRVAVVCRVCGALLQLIPAERLSEELAKGGQRS